LSAFKDFPLFGSGLGTFEHVFKIYQPEGLTGYYDHAHNDYLELLLEAGIFGVLIGGFFFFIVLRGILKKEWREREIYLKAGFLSSLATMAVHSVFDFNLHIPSNAVLFCLILGMAVSFGRGINAS
jgi:O-antigen ligase